MSDDRRKRGREGGRRKREGSLGIVTRNRERGEHFAHAHSHVRESAHISLALLLSQGGHRMGHKKTFSLLTMKVVLTLDLEL